MTRKSRQSTQPNVEKIRRPLWWQVGATVVAIAAVAVYLIVSQPTVASEPDPSKLVGRWLRPDGGYVLALSKPTADGQLTAAYSNPRPINVAGAEWKLQDDHLRVFVELRDTHYPGCTYMLVYQPDADRLMGVYFQAALGQQFDVVFERMK
jgi:hypothetical protein